MSYEQHTWVDGETITASKMNNIEAGIVEASQSGGGGGGVLKIPGTWDSGILTLEASYNDIVSAWNSGVLPVAVYDDQYGDGEHYICPLIKHRIYSGRHLASFYDEWYGGGREFSATLATDNLYWEASD